MGSIIPPAIKGLTMTNMVLNGVRQPNVINADYYIDDGLILSFCNGKDASIRDRLGKKVCVEISDIMALREHFDRALGCTSKYGCCEYTSAHERNHFLKHVEDSWQKEFRLFWALTEFAERWVSIPAGFAKLVEL